MLAQEPIVWYNTQLMVKNNKPLQFLALLPLPLASFLGIEDQLPNSLVEDRVMAQHEMSLDNRYQDKFVNDVFKDNILLNLAYLREAVKSKADIKRDELTKPFVYEFRLDPDKSFAFHEDVDQKYQDSLSKTTNAHFNAQEGFKTDGYLYGDGVCHLASLLYWVARDAGLDAEAPTNHDFMNIPDIPREYGVSIYSNPFSKGSNAQQNLYITNNKGKPLSFKFEYDGERVKVLVAEEN